MSEWPPQRSATTEILFPRRIFTVARADRALVLVSRIVADVVSEFRKLLELQELLEKVEQSEDRRSAREAHRQIRETFGRLKSYREELEDVGVELKDWLRGVVHFPAVVDGKPVCLCWRHGEAKVTHWHRPEACHAGRRSTSELIGRYQSAPIRIHQALEAARTTR
ncbi:MAG: DUF2203 domain-containing protein [Planctomycetota bacterium]